jgi:hypothetical protein
MRRPDRGWVRPAACAFAAVAYHSKSFAISGARLVDLDAMRGQVVDVADRRPRGPVALFGLLEQSFLDLLAQVVDVVLRPSTLMPWRNLSDERESRETIAFSLTK